MVLYIVLSACELSNQIKADFPAYIRFVTVHMNFTNFKIPNPRRMSQVWFILSALLCSQISHAEPITIAGRIFTESGPLQGAVVNVFENYQDLVDQQNPFRTSEPSDKKGLYSLELIPGTYYFTAHGKNGEKKFAAYHGANPLSVRTKNLWITFMAHEVKEPVYTDGDTSVQGIVLYKGRPVKGAHVAFYTTDARKFKGLGFLADKGLGFMKAVDDDGTFFIPLVADKYVVIARKMKGKNEVRPLRRGDLFCYAPANPVDVKQNKNVRIEIPCYPKADRLAFIDSPQIKSNDFLTIDKSEDGESYGIKGKVTDGKGEPVADVYVIAYKTGDASTPTREAENITRTDKEGKYFIPLQADGYFGLVVRDTLGAAPGTNDLAGLYNEDPWKGINFKTGELIENINITIPDDDRKLFE